MKAIINIPASDKMPKGKYIDLAVIRRIGEQYPSYTLQELIEMVKEVDTDMDENQVSEFIRLKIANNASHNNKYNSF